MQAIFFGSIGTLVETSEIQRKAFNTAFKEFGLNWYWNIGNYINMIQKPGGIQRIKEYSRRSSFIISFSTRNGRRWRR